MYDSCLSNSWNENITYILVNIYDHTHQPHLHLHKQSFSLGSARKNTNKRSVTKRPGPYWSQLSRALSARASLFHVKARGPLQLGSSAISTTNHLTTDTNILHMYEYIFNSKVVKYESLNSYGYP